MQGRARIFIVIGFLIVIIAVVLVVALSGQPRTTTTTTTTTTDDGTDTASATTGGGAGSVGGAGTEPTIAPSTPVPLVEIVVAVQEISRGQVIAPNMVELRLYPEAAAPFNSLGSIELVIGKIARTDIFIEQPILSNMLAENLTGIGAFGSDAAAVLPSNRVAIAVPMDRLTSVAYGIQPGDRVDVIVSMLFVDVDAEFQSKEPNLFIPYSITVDDAGSIVFEAGGTGFPGNFESRPIPPIVIGETTVSSVLGVTSPSENQRPRLVTQRTVQDALVVWLGDFPRDGKIFGIPPTPTPLPTVDPAQSAAEQDGTVPPTPTPLPPRPDVVTLGVTPQDAVVLTWFIEARLPITFTLRSATTTSQAPTDAVSLDYIMSRYRIELPQKRAFSIEPAIRSIRQLIFLDELTLNP